MTRSGLTRSEEKVVELLSTGMTNAEMADALSVSLATITHHVHNIMEKTGFSNRVKLTRWWITNFEYVPTLDEVAHNKVSEFAAWWIKNFEN